MRDPVHATRSAWRPPASFPLLGLIAIIGAAAWTLLGCLLAAASSSFSMYWREWVFGQAFFAVAAALFLGFLSLSRCFAHTIAELSPQGDLVDHWQSGRAVKITRFAVIAFIFIVGTFSLIKLGFGVRPPTRYFMWLTCAGICFFAGFATWHGIEVLYLATHLSELKVKFFVYSPGETRSLKKLAVYFVIYGLGMTIGYVFAFVGTMSPLWQGNPVWVNTVRAFWPIIYVPLCLTIATYPHLCIFRLIRQEKDRLIVLYQEQINSIIGEGHSLSREDVERINSLADLIKRIDTSPSFAFNFPIALGTAVTYVVNIATLIVPKELLLQTIKKSLFGH
jgi:hypothetical protein